MRGHPGDTAQGQRMVAAQQDRHALRNGLSGGGLQRLRPGQRLGQGMHHRVFRHDIGQRTGRKITPVFHAVTKLAQCLYQPRHAVGRGAHEATGTLLAGIDRGTDQDAMGHRRVPFLSGGCARPEARSAPGRATAPHSTTPSTGQAFARPPRHIAPQGPPRSTDPADP